MHGDILDIVHASDGLLRIGIRDVADKAEPSASARVTVLDHDLDDN